MFKLKELPKTIKKTQESLLRRDFSATELTKNYLDRINSQNKDLNIFLTITAENALRDALRIDKLLESKDKKIFNHYPLLGVTVAHKDIFLTKGIRTTAGAKLLADYLPEYSGTAVARIEEKGAICLGKVNCDAWAHGSSGENSDFGPTLNPFNKEYVAGGSSSGSAAAVAAEMALTATGTDTCGSIRVPANFCGVYGLKPTYGRVSRYGVIAMASSLDTVGFFGNSVEDIEILFQSTKGSDGYDSTLKEAGGKIKKTGFKVGIPKEFFGEGLDFEVSAKIDEARKVFEKVGISFMTVSLPSTPYGIAVYYIIQPAEVSSNLGRFDGIRFGRDRESFSAEAKRRIMLGTYVLSAGYYDTYYLKAMKVRTLIRKEIDQVFEKVDAIIAPVAPTPAFKVGEKTDDPLKMYLTDIYAATANLSGIPALAIPFGKSKIGLPLGFQLMAPRFNEEILFNLARLFETQNA